MSILRYKKFALADGGVLRGGSSGGGGGGPTTSTTYSSNVPEYARPYVENMLQSAQTQIYNDDMTSFRPYQPYSTNVNDYFAGFSPLQQQAQQQAYSMQTPGQFGAGSGLAGMAGLGSLGIAGQAAGAGQQYAQQVTNPYAVQQYMSPYQQNVTDVAKNAAVREARMAENINKLGAARQGTYGGARQLLGSTERERNLLSNLSNIQAQGSQSAYDKAIQSQQFGANLGLQGYGAALQGLGQATQAGSVLGQLGTGQLGAEQGIISTKSTLGAQQQQLEQNKINQAIQDYATAQQYPFMQLGMMNAMLRGLPLQQATTQQYQAAPNTLSQLSGLGLTGAAMYGMAKKKGGKIEDKKEGSGLAALELNRLMGEKA